METDNILRGDDLMVFDSNNSPMAFATSHTLNMSVDTNEVNTKDAGMWKYSLPSKIGWELQTENLCCMSDYQSLYNKMVLRNPVKVTIGSSLKFALNGQGTYSSNIYRRTFSAPTTTLKMDVQNRIITTSGTLAIYGLFKVDPGECIYFDCGQRGIWYARLDNDVPNNKTIKEGAAFKGLTQSLGTQYYRNDKSTTQYVFFGSSSNITFTIYSFSKTGYANLTNLTLNANTGDIATYSATFQGVDKLITNN